MSRATRGSRRPLVFALALAGVCAGASVLSWAFDAPTAGAVLVAASSPGVLVTLHEALRLLDRPDATARRSGWMALLLLLIPLATLMALAARLSEGAPWETMP